jgi:hypothetical protein
MSELSLQGVSPIMAKNDRDTPEDRLGFVRDDDFSLFATVDERDKFLPE